MKRSFRLRPNMSLCCLGALLTMIGTAVACQVPVFRYALERWSNDRYPVWVMHHGELSAQQQQAVDLLRGDRGVNLKLINLIDTQETLAKEIWNRQGQQNQPLLVSFFPQASDIPAQQPAHISPLSMESATQFLKSAVREEIVRKLTAGDSAVWIFLESGDKAKDEVALTTLTEQLAKDADWLELPSAEELEIKPEILASAKIKLQVAFSVVRVKRDDPQEKFLVDCLLNSEPDLRDFTEPMAFPVFGRGRVLYALVGKGIATSTIRSASSFIVGPCSCQVKEQNPGFDLLLKCDWDQALGSTLISSPNPTEVPGTTVGQGAEPKLLTIPPGRNSRSKSN